MIPLLLAAAVAASPACSSDRFGRLSISRKAQLPAEIREDLRGIADAGESFQVSDSLPGPDHPPFERFVSAQRLHYRLTVTTERGGIAHTWDATEYEFRQGHWRAIGKRPLNLPRRSSR